MMNPQRALAAYLEHRGCGTYEAKTGWGIFIDSEPADKPENCITVYMTGGNPEATLTSLGNQRVKFQVRYRSSKAVSGQTAKEAGYAIAQAVEGMIGMAQNLTCGDRLFYFITAYTEIIPLGFNEKGVLALHVQNFTATIKRDQILNLN